jgi:hypothetical protein
VSIANATSVQASSCLLVSASKAPAQNYLVLARVTVI